MRHLIRLAALTLLLPLAGCLTIRETLTVKADGALEVEIRARGQAEDLLDGFAVPLHGGWRARGAETARWLEEIGPDTGSDATLERGRASPWIEELKRAEKEIELRSSAKFASAGDVPEIYAPGGIPYRTALLRRGTSLRVETKSGRRVYTFERVYHRRASETQRLWERIFDDDDPVAAKLKSGKPLEGDEERKSADLLTRYAVGCADHYVREAVGALYVEGGAGLALEERGRVLSAVRDELERWMTQDMMVATLRAIWDAGAREAAGEDVRAATVVERVDAEYRERMRSTLKRELERTGLAPELINGVLFRFEHLLSEDDQTEDLLDETLDVVVHMPGTIVSGNHILTEDGAARWRVEGKELLGHDVVLTVTSVVEER